MRIIAAARAEWTSVRIGWSGTFHAVGARLLRGYAMPLGWTPRSPFTIAQIRLISTNIVPP